MKVSVLGAGSWGTTIAILLYYNGHSVTLWEHDKQYAKVMQRTRKNPTFLPDADLPDDMHITHSLNEAVEKQNLVICAVPSQFARSAIHNIDEALIHDQIFLSLSKGIETKTLMTMSQMFKDTQPKLDLAQIAVLSGPSHAEEVYKRIPTTVVAASTDEETSQTVQAALMTSYFRVYSSTDVLGVELGGAFKNVIAIGAGMLDGIGYGDNTKAALMTRGVAEMKRLGIALGAKPETFAGLSGMGDLIVTCMSRHSRNRFVGEKIGGGMTLNQVLKEMKAVAEGVDTSRSASELARNHKVETPITWEVNKILFEDKDPVRALMDLMTREMKSE